MSMDAHGGEMSGDVRAVLDRQRSKSRGTQGVVGFSDRSSEIDDHFNHAANRSAGVEVELTTRSFWPPGVRPSSSSNLPPSSSVLPPPPAPPAPLFALPTPSAVMFDSKCDSQKEGLDSTGLETENFKDTKHVKSVGFEFSDDQTDEIATNDQSVSKRPQLQGSASRSASMNAREWTRLRMLRSRWERRVVIERSERPKEAIWASLVGYA